MWLKLAERHKMQLKMDRFTERHLNSSLTSDSADLANSISSMEETLPQELSNVPYGEQHGCLSNPNKVFLTSDASPLPVQSFSCIEEELFFRRFFFYYYNHHTMQRQLG